MWSKIELNFSTKDAERLYKLVEESYYQKKKLLKICDSDKTRVAVENDIRILKSFINQYLSN